MTQEPNVRRAILEEVQLVNKAITVLAAQPSASFRVLPVLMVLIKQESVT